MICLQLNVRAGREQRHVGDVVEPCPPWVNKVVFDEMYVVRGFERVDYLRLKIRVGNEQVLPIKGQTYKAVRGGHNQGVVGWAINNLLWRACMEQGTCRKQQT